MTTLKTRKAKLMGWLFIIILWMLGLLILRNVVSVGWHRWLTVLIGITLIPMAMAITKWLSLLPYKTNPELIAHAQDLAPYKAYMVYNSLVVIEKKTYHLDAIYYHDTGVLVWCRQDAFNSALMQAIFQPKLVTADVIVVRDYAHFIKALKQGIDQWQPPQDETILTALKQHMI